MIEPPEPDAHVTAREKALKEEMLAFLEELTLLTRRTLVVVSSNGDIDVNSLRKISQKDAARGRYVFFWSIDGKSEGVRYPVDIIWQPGEDDPENLVDFDNVT